MRPRKWFGYYISAVYFVNKSLPFYIFFENFSYTWIATHFTSHCQSRLVKKIYLKSFLILTGTKTHFCDIWSYPSLIDYFLSFWLTACNKCKDFLRKLLKLLLPNVIICERPLKKHHEKHTSTIACYPWIWSPFGSHNEIMCSI